MTPRDNLLNLYRRHGAIMAPVYFNLCPHLEQEFHRRYPGRAAYAEQFQFPMRLITDPGFPWIAEIPSFVLERKWEDDLYYDPSIAPKITDLACLPDAHAGAGGAVGEHRGLRRGLPGVETMSQFAEPETDRSAAGRKLGVTATSVVVPW